MSSLLGFFSQKRRKIIKARGSFLRSEKKNQKVFKNIFEKIKRIFEDFSKKMEKSKKVSKKMGRKTVWNGLKDMHIVHRYVSYESFWKKMKKT